MMSAYRPKIILLVESGELDAVNGLIAKGCDVNEKDELGRCAVHTAAKGNKLQMLRVLINAGARVDVVDDLGQTPLSIAKKNQPFSDEMVSVIEQTIANYSSLEPPRL